MAETKKDDEAGREEKDEEAEDEDGYKSYDPDAERKEQYLDFKRKMDGFKGEQEGMTSESESFKAQGNAYFSFGCYAQATLMYSDALELQPHNAVLYCNRAMAYLKQDMADLALADANRSLDIESSVDNIKAYWRKAQALLDMNRYEEAEAAASAGLELHGRNPHLNKVRRKAREASVVDRLVAGEWAGKLENGIEQRLAFSREGDMNMTVFGHSLTSTYELSVEGNPRSMVVKMKAEVTPGCPPPPPMVYIFEFGKDDQELWLCHPVDGSKDLPTKFEGAGLVKHRRVEPQKASESEALSDEPLDVRCARYMREMCKVLPLIPPQLPEKPSDEQIKDEVQICGSVSGLKQKHGLEVHRRAVELARAPSTADSEEMRELAQQLRHRFVARKLLPEEAKEGVQKAPESATPAEAPESAMPDAEAGEASATAVAEAALDASSSPVLESTAPAERSADVPQGLKTMPSSGEPQGADLLRRLLPCICGA